MQEMKLKALAKINLGLDVLRRRDDGYHEVRMIMQTLKMYDKITIRKMKEPGIQLKSNLFYVPENESNLAYRAARLLMDEFQVEEGVFIDLQKFIPVAAGMAGGSSDAAAVLYGVNRLFGLKLTKRQLMERGVKIGADVPYCIMRGTVLAEGIGEELTPLPPMPPCKVLVAKPQVSVSTKNVYMNLDMAGVTKHPEIDAQLEGIREGDLHKIASRMGNVLETVTIPSHPVIAQIREEMMRLGALNAMMSGSGPTVFGLFDDEQAARRAYEELEAGEMAKNVVLTKFFRSRRV